MSSSCTCRSEVVYYFLAKRFFALARVYERASCLAARVGDGVGCCYLQQAGRLVFIIPALARFIIAFSGRCRGLLEAFISSHKGHVIRSSSLALKADAAAETGARTHPHSPPE